jgi:tetratricopeptide (TPR) repeat protein
MYKIDNFLEKVKEALFEEAYEWVDEHCRKKLKKYPNDIRLHTYLCIGAYKNKQYRRVINKACNALDNCQRDDKYTLVLQQLLNLSLNKLEMNIHGDVIIKARNYAKDVGSLILKNQKVVKEIIEDDPDIFNELFEGDRELKKDLNREKRIGFDLLMEDKDIEAIEHISRYFGPTQKDNFVEACIAYLFAHYKEANNLCDEILSKDNEPLILALKARCLYNLNNIKSALSYYEKAINSGLKYHCLYFEQANCLTEVGRKKEALKLYNKLLKTNSLCPETLSNKAAILIELEQYNQAIKEIDNGLKLNPHDDFLWYNKGIALIGLNRDDDAIKCFIKLTELIGNVQELIKLGEKFKLEQKFNKSLECYNNVIIIDKNNETAMFGLIECLIELNHKEKAIEYSSKLINISKDENMLERLLEILKELGGDTINCSNKILALNPDNKVALIEKSIYLTNKCKYESAINYMGKISGHYGVEFLLCKAICLEKLGKYEKAKTYYKYVLKINKNNRKAITGIKHCNKALAKKKFLIQKMESAKLLETMNNYEAALKNYNIILDLIPDNDLILQRKADCLLKLNQQKEAVECYKYLIDLTNNENILTTILKIFKKLKINTEDCYKKLLRINPSNETALIEKGIYLTKSEEYREAFLCFSKLSREYIDKEYLICRAITSQFSERYALAVRYYAKVINETIKDVSLLTGYFYLK